MIRLIVNAVLFQVGWLACILGAANGYLWLGGAVVAAIVVVNVAMSPAPARELVIILAVGVAGAVIDTTLHAAGLLTLPPVRESGFAWQFVPWIAALWFNFAATLTGCLRWLARRPVLAALLGALSGPSTYYAGARLGAIGFSEPLWGGIVALAVEWAIVLPVTLLVARRIQSGTTIEESTQQGGAA